MPSREVVVDACRRGADLLLGHRWKLWFWTDSIGPERLLDASDVTGDDRYFGYVYGFLRAWVPRAAERSRFDHTAAGVTLVRSYRKTGFL